MRFDIILIRLVFTGILLAAGYVLHPIPGHRLISTAAAGLVAIAIIFFEMRILGGVRERRVRNRDHERCAQRLPECKRKRQAGKPGATDQDVDTLQGLGH